MLLILLMTFVLLVIFCRIIYHYKFTHFEYYLVYICELKQNRDRVKIAGLQHISA